MRFTCAGMQLSVSQSLAYRTVYNHSRDASFLTRYAIVSTVYNHPRDAVVGPPVVGPIGRSTIIQWMRFSCIEYAVVSFPVVGLSNGLQSSKGCVSSALSIQLSLYQLLGYRTVYNPPREAFFLHRICNCRYGSQSSKGCVSSA